MMMFIVMIVLMTVFVLAFVVVVVHVGCVFFGESLGDEIVEAVQEADVAVLREGELLAGDLEAGQGVLAE